MPEEDLIHRIEIVYTNRRTCKNIKQDSCPFWKPDYCDNPLRKQDIECRYGLTEIRVPEKCPLRERPTINKIALLIEKIKSKD